MRIDLWQYVFCYSRNCTDEGASDGDVSAGRQDIRAWDEHRLSNSLSQVSFDYEILGITVPKPQLVATCQRRVAPVE